MTSVGSWQEQLATARMPKPGAERWLFFGQWAIAIAFLVTVATMLGNRNDLDIFLAASRDLWAGGDIYGITYFDGYHYYYSPFFAMLVTPLSWLPAALAKAIWGALILLAVWRSYRIIASAFFPASLSSVQRNAIGFFTFLFLFQAIRDNLNSSQVTAFVLWSCIEGLHQVRHHRPLLGALCIAVGLDMKLLPLVLLPYLVYRREWKAAIMVGATVVVLTLLPALFLGWQQNIDLLASRGQLLQPTDPKHILDADERSFIALSSLISAYFSADINDPHVPDLPRTIVALDLGTIAVILMIGRALLVLFFLRFLLWPPFVAARSSLHVWWECSYLLLCTVLIFPHQQYYAMLLGMPAIAWITCTTVVRWTTERSAMTRWLVLCAMVYLITNAGLLVGEFSYVYTHYKTTSFMVFVLIGMLWWCKPEKLEPVQPSTIQ